MNVHDAIFTRRSVRHYAETPLERDVIEDLLQAAVHAPSATNTQSWAFGMVQDKALLKEYSDRAKAAILAQIDTKPDLERYRNALGSPAFNIFYNAPALVVIYSKPIGPGREINCCLAAENLMLAAWEKGIGSCWIGFAFYYLELAEAKRELGVPEDYTAVAPIILGYPASAMPEIPRNPPEILFWK